MKFTCERDIIIREISIAQEIISSRNALSILSNVLLEASENTVLIRATDLKVGFETRIPADVSVSGSTTVFCDKFIGILRSLPAGDIEFEQTTDGKDSDSFVIRPVFKKIDFRLKSIASDKFPEIQTASDELFFDFSQKDFMEMISQTVFAVSDDETRYFMNGVYLENNEGNLVMVATDGRRLSYISKHSESALKEFPGIIVPPKVLNLIRKLASGEGTFSVAVTEKNLFVNFDNQKLTSALIEGQFPNYRRVIPEQQQYLVTLKKDELVEAIKRVSLLVEKSRRIYLTIGDNAIVLTSEESEIGLAREEISCKYDGPETTMALNYQYLMEPLKVITDEEVILRFTEANKAVSMYSVPERDFFHIIMPMQLE
jgi:DNA polymerase-3 subunit beta